MTLRDNLASVTATIAPSALGGYLHTMTWHAAPCLGGCSYRYKTYSTNGGTETASPERVFSMFACLE